MSPPFKHALALALILTGCNAGQMRDQPRADPLEVSRIFEDGIASRPLVDGTVARGQLRIDEHFYEGKVNGRVAETFPRPVTRNLLARGRQRYNIFCAACHDRVGTGNGMVVQRGFPRPSSYHTQRMRAQPVGYIYDVITNGYGRMPDYRDQIPVADRWAIVAYVRALQLSQYVERGDLAPQDLQRLNAAGSPAENAVPKNQ